MSFYLIILSELGRETGVTTKIKAKRGLKIPRFCLCQVSSTLVRAQLDKNAVTINRLCGSLVG